MPKQFLVQTRFNGGISDSEKEGIKGSYLFARNLDIYSDPGKISLNPRSIKISDNVVTDLVKWIVSGAPYNNNIYFYDGSGKIYQKDLGDNWTLLRTLATGAGQGLEIHNDYLYYTQNTSLGRYGPLSGSPSFVDGWATGLNDTSGTGFAPLKAFKEGLAVGHGNLLGWYDGTVWTIDKLVLPPGFNIRSLEVIDEFLVISAWRGLSITQAQESYLFFWDGTATTYNFFVKSEEGAIQAIINNQNRLFSVIGNKGAIYIGHSPFEKIHQIPNLEIDRELEIFPSSITNWRNLIHFGLPATTSSSSLIRGVYIWGSKNNRLPEVMTMGYTISTNNFSTCRIGAVKGIGSELYIAWQDGANFGVDKVTITNPPYSLGVFESLIFDNGAPMNEKLAETFKVSHLPLRSGESIEVGYKVDREPNYTSLTNTTLNSTTSKINISLNKSRFKEIQFKIGLGTSSNTSPSVTGLSFKFDDLVEEVSTGR